MAVTIEIDLTEFLRKYGAIEFSPVRKPKPRASAFTPAELEEMRQSDARRAELEANAPYFGWPEKKPLRRDPLVCEVAELLKEFD